MSFIRFFVFVFVFIVISYGQVPPADECQFVNATEPPECPKTIGPPCPPCVVNEARDYETGDSLILTQATRDSIHGYMQQYLDYWPSHYPPSSTTGGPSIVIGAAGRSLIFLRMYNYTANQSYLDLARDYIDSAIKQLPRFDNSPSYFGGRTGVYIVAAQIANFQNDADKLVQYLANITDIFGDVQEAMATNRPKSKTYGFDMSDGCIMTGLGGLLYSGMLVDEYFGGTVVTRQFIVNLAHYLIQIGLDLAAQFNEDFLVYKFGYGQSCFLPGSAEGSGGVVKMLLEAYNRGFVPDLMSNASYKNALQNTINWFVSIQLQDGNMPTYSDNERVACGAVYGHDNDERVQWCHGAPGFIDTFSLSAVAFDSFGDIASADRYLNAALLAFNATWRRGLLIKGLMQCHGIGGNAYSLLHLYKNLEIISRRNTILNNYFDVAFLMKQSMWRAIQFVTFTLDARNLNVLRTEYSNEDYSLWLGSYGIPVLYIQAIQEKWPQSEPVCMVAYDFCGV